MGINETDDLEIGTAGEHIVCANLLVSGYKAHMTDQAYAYDVIVDVRGKLLRIQVKTTRYQRLLPQRKLDVLSYVWHPRKAGKRGMRQYPANSFDLYAFVALDIFRVAYLPPTDVLNIIEIRHPEYVRPPGKGRNPDKHFDDFTFDKAIANMGVTHE